VIETVFESSIFPSKKDRAILFIYPVNLIVKPLPRACEAGPTLIIEHVVYATSRFDFYFRQFQYLPFDFIKYFSLSCYQNRKELKNKRRPDFNATFLLPIKNHVKNIFHS